MIQNQNNIRVDIDRYFIDTDGQLLDKATIPANLQTKMPWFMFGKFDMDCNYRNASRIITPDEPWKFIGVYNRSAIKFLFTGLNNFQSVMQNGDLSLLFCDDIVNPSYYAIVVMSSQSSGLSGIVQNVEFMSPWVDLYSNNAVEDYTLSLTYGEVSKFGIAIAYDSYPLARAYNPMARPENNKIQINQQFLANYQKFIGGYISFNTTAYYIDFRKISY